MYSEPRSIPRSSLFRTSFPMSAVNLSRSYLSLAVSGSRGQKLLIRKCFNSEVAPPSGRNSLQGLAMSNGEQLHTELFPGVAVVTNFNIDGESYCVRTPCANTATCVGARFGAATWPNAQTRDFADFRGNRADSAGSRPPSEEQLT